MLLKSTETCKIFLNYGQRKRSPILLLRSSKDFRETSNESISPSLTKNQFASCYHFDRRYVKLRSDWDQQLGDENGSKYIGHTGHPSYAFSISKWS